MITFATVVIIIIVHVVQDFFWVCFDVQIFHNC